MLTVRDFEPKLFDAPRTPQYPMGCIMPDPNKKENRRRLGETVAKDAAMKACEHWGEAKALCVADVMAMGDLEVAQAGVF